MFTLIAQNKYGQQLELTHNDAYVIESIDGLDPPDAQINTTKNANDDGSVYNSSYVDNRVITITLAINGPAEANRINLYKYFKSKMPVRLYYKNETRNVYIDGYVQRMPIGFFDPKQIVQITIFCPKPFFNGATDSLTDFSSVISEFEFPFSVEESKNILPYPYYQTSRIDSGLTYTDNGDGSITINGTNESSAVKAFLMRSRDNEDYKLPAGTYVLSGGISSSQRAVINYMKDGATSATTLAASSGNETTFTVTEDISQYPLQVGIYTSAGASWDNVTVYPMIRVATVEDDTWQEYDNPDGLIEFSEILLEQDKNIINNGDVETGIVIIMRARGPLTNPTIFNVETNEFFSLNISMIKGDEIQINTKKKEKSVVLISNGITTNIVGKLKNGSTWFQLNPGDNLFTTSAETSPENLDTYCIITDRFEGV